MSFLGTARLLFPLSLLLTGVSLVFLFVPGPELSVEFTGGTLLELRLPGGATQEALEQALRTFAGTEKPLGNTARSFLRGGTVLLRTRTLSNDEHRALLAHMTATLGQTTELQFTTIGPTVGSSLKKRAGIALVVASLATILYLAFAFRKIPKRLSPWSFGISAVIALLHDVSITTGIFIILSRTTSFEVDLLFVTALLSIMGYSVNDTIVIFDRIRDNLFLGGKHEDFAAIAERSLRQTLSRTINTGTGALIMLTALALFGAASIRWFLLALIVGTVIGTYSSFFVATPILIYLKKKE